MKSGFLIWDASIAGNACILKWLTNVEDSFELTKCVPRQKGFPTNAEFHMNADSPKAIALTDNLYNMARLVVISGKLKAFLEQKQVKGVEYLPVTIMNHKGRAASKDYFLLHTIAAQDVLDAKKSGAEWSEMVEDQIDEVERLIIDESKIDPEITVFRLKSFGKVVLVRRGLAEELSAAGFSGLSWVELDEFGQ